MRWGSNSVLRGFHNATKMDRPEYFYKYRAITNDKASEDEAIDALLKSKAIFSSRKNFNDLFDSKIHFQKPTAQELKELRNNCNKEKKRIIAQWINKGKITVVGRDALKKAEQDFNKLTDSYLFYCVSGTCTNNLMWSHYANSHKGFCIEFKSSHVAAEKITYQREIPTIELAEIIAIAGTSSVPDRLVEKIWSALKVKLQEWEYEDEYRFQLSNSGLGNNLKPGEKFLIVPYQSDFVKSVIFGCKMTEAHKLYIAENIPLEIELKQAVEGKSNISIVESSLKTTVLSGKPI